MKYKSDYQTPATKVTNIPWTMFLVLAAALFFVSHSLSYYENQQMASVGGGSLVREIDVFFLGAFSTVILLRRQPNVRLRMNGWLAWVLLSFVFWVFLSPIWAIDISLTVKRLVVFGVLCLASVMVARRFSLREIVLWAFFTTTAFLVISVLAEVISGNFIPFASGYRFAGTLPPNDQGIECGILMLSAFAAAGLEKRRRIFFRACALLAFCFLILTRSRTSLAASLLAFVVYIIAVSSRRRHIVATLGFALALGTPLVIAGGVLQDLQSAAMLGRTDSEAGSFNGRTGVWKDVLYYVDRHPVLGYGYGGFWTPARTQLISDEERWGVPDSHSAYLDCLLTLGAVGLAAYTFLLLAGITRAFRFQRRSRNPAFAFCGALLVFCTLEGALESAVFEPTLATFLVMIVLVRLGFIRRPQRLPQSSLNQAPRALLEGTAIPSSVSFGNSPEMICGSKALPTHTSSSSHQKLTRLKHTLRSI